MIVHCNLKVVCRARVPAPARHDMDRTILPASRLPCCAARFTVYVFSLVLYETTVMLK